MPTLVDSSEACAVEVSFTADSLTVVLDDGRTVSVPIAWFPRLSQATEKQRARWELIGSGVGVHWEAIDEDISVASLLRPAKFMRMPEPRLNPSFSPRRSRRTQAPSARKRGSSRNG